MSIIIGRRSAAPCAVIFLTAILGSACSDDGVSADAGLEGDAGVRGDARIAADASTDVDMGMPVDVGEDIDGSREPSDGHSNVEGLPSAGYVALGLYYGAGFDMRGGVAELYSDYTIQGDAEPPQPPLMGPQTEDVCIFELGSQTETVSYTYFDVGPQLAVSADDEMHIYERSTDGDQVYYAFSAFPFGQRWMGGPISIDIPGSSAVPGARFSNVLHVPGTEFELVGTSTAITSTTGSNVPIAFTWTPDPGAQRAEAHVNDVFGTDLVFRCSCKLVDDGSFTLPPGCLDATMGDLLIVQMDHIFMKDVEFDGRRLRIIADITAQIDFARVVE